MQARVDSFKTRIRALEASMDNGISAAKSRTRMSGDRVQAAEHAVEAAEAVYKTASLNLKRQKSLSLLDLLLPGLLKWRRWKKQEH